MVSINRNFGVKAANTQPPAQEAVTKNDKNGTTNKEPAVYPEEQKAAKPKEHQGGEKDVLKDVTNGVSSNNPHINFAVFNLFDHIF